MSRVDLAEMVATARAKADAERALSSIRSRLADVDDEAQALASVRAGRRWFRRGADPAAALEERKQLLADARAELAEQARRLTREADGAEGARIAVGAELSRREADLRASGDAVDELDRLLAERASALERLRLVDDAIERAEECRGIAERTAYLERTEGLGGGTVVFTGTMQPTTLAHDPGVPRALIGEAVLRERLGVLATVLAEVDAAPLGRVVEGPTAALGAWLGEVDHTLQRTGEVLRVQRTIARDELVAVDNRRIALLGG